jgi:hypothetical protein
MKTKVILPRPEPDRSVTPPTVAHINKLRQFRSDLYDVLPHRPAAILDLLDALASNTQARSPVELSLNPLFRRQYGSIYDAVDSFFVPPPRAEARVARRAHELRLVRLLADLLPRPHQRKFWLFGIDRTPAPRRFAETLADRSYVHQPNALRGNQPVTLGHDYLDNVRLRMTQALLEDPVGVSSPGCALTHPGDDTDERSGR